MLAWNHTTRWIKAEQLVVGSVGHDGIVRLAFQHIVDLAISKKEHNAGFHLVLKDKVLVVVANFYDV